MMSKREIVNERAVRKQSALGIQPPRHSGVLPVAIDTIACAAIKNLNTDDADLLGLKRTMAL
jgi:hypothetical protein